MSKPSRQPVSGKTLKAMLAKLQTEQEQAAVFRLRPIAAHVRFICQHWNSPDILFNVQVK